MTRFVRYLQVTAILGLAAMCVAALRAAEPDPKTAPRAEVPPAEQLVRQIKRQHPRLLTDQAGFDRLRERIKTDPTLVEWDKQVQRYADDILKSPLPQHVIPDGLRLLSTSRSVVDHTYTLALMYRLHGEKRWAERLWQEMQAVAAFPDFNPRHFLDTAEMTHGMAIAYDWLYDTWTDAQRATIRRGMIDMGLNPGLRVCTSGHGWPMAANNWNNVCNGGLTMGALAIGDEEPELAGQILRHALVSLPRAMHSYVPDGACGEGPGYWGYGTSYTVVMIAGLQSALGADFGLSGMPGFDQTGMFPIYMLGPTDRLFNFSDCGDRLGAATPMLWLDQRFNLPACAWFAASRGRPSALAMLWYRGPGQSPESLGLPLDRYWRNVEVATFRSQWNDPKGWFVGIQSGSNRVNHNHLDLGSFVLDALGQRWAVDLGSDDYNLPGYFGGQRYDYYRLRAEGHNTLVLNPDKGPDQDSRAIAKISRFVSDGPRAFAISDLTPAYAKSAKRVERGVSMLKRRSVLVQDEIEADRPADVWWFLHTPAAVTLSEDGRTATLQQGDAKLAARLLTPIEARFTVQPAEPMASSPHPERQGRNGNVRKLSIHLPTASSVRLAVLLATPDAPADAGSAPKIAPLAEW